MAKNVKPIPDGYRAVTPGLAIDGAAQAIEFYKKAFGATDVHECMKGPDGKIMHAELKIGDSIIMVSEAFPQWGCEATRSRFYIYTDDCDALLARAAKAGAKPEQPATDQFWGDRMGSVRDAWGNVWSIATHKEDLTPEQIKQRGEEWMAAAAK
ncbi:MAG: VOC family protein [Elusimicrobia bacterium]|nr:VOC family protein [Elusimicrobiota bacterium]